MLPKRHRFQRRRQIKEVKQKGKLFSSPLFGILILRLTQNTPSCFGFVISTKIHKRATKRNYLKRLLSETTKNLLPQIKPGFYCLFLAKKTLLKSSLQDIQKEVKNTFKKAKILKTS